LFPQTILLLLVAVAVLRTAVVEQAGSALALGFLLLLAPPTQLQWVLVEQEVLLLLREPTLYLVPLLLRVVVEAD
jgi:hypothetical protein